MIKNKKILLVLLLFGSHVIPSMNRSEALRILRLDDNVSDKGVITKAYRDLALQYHPDKNIGATDDKKKEAAENFKKVQSAYEFLIKPATSGNDLTNAKEENARQMVKDLLEDYTNNAGQLIRGLNFYINQYVTKKSLRDENPNFINFLKEKKTGFDALLNAGSIDKETFTTEINNLLEAKRQEQNATDNTANQQRKEEERLRQEQEEQERIRNAEKLRQEQERIRQEEEERKRINEERIRQMRQEIHQRKQSSLITEEEDTRKQLEAEMNQDEELLKTQFQREYEEIFRREKEVKDALKNLEREETQARKNLEGKEAKSLREIKKEMNLEYEEIAKREKIEKIKQYIDEELHFFDANNNLYSDPLFSISPKEIRSVIKYEKLEKFLNDLYDHILNHTNYDKDVARYEIDILLKKIEHQRDEELRIIKDQKNRKPLMEALRYVNSLS